MKLIALDVGTKRIGVAKADSNVRIAVPYNAVEVDGEEFSKIAALVRAWGIDGVVIGLPRNNQGEETAQSQYSRQFAAQLKKVLPATKICFQDESLTSVEAESRLNKQRKNFKKGDIDSEAATIILQDFLEAHTGKKSTVRAAAARRQPSVKARKPHKLAIALISVIILLAAAVLGGFIYYNNTLLATEPDCTANCEVLLTIEQGSSVNQVASLLQNSGLAQSSLTFQIYYRLNHADSDIQAGEYTLNKTMPVSEIAKILITGSDSNVFSFTIKPGETLQEIRTNLAQVGFSEAEIDAALKHNYQDKPYSWIFEGRPAEASLEGYLFGETYEFYRSDSAEVIIDRYLENMAKVLQENDLGAKYSALGLNLYQGITMASIVQKEASNPTDQAKVAQVFYNRLAQGMNLGSDVTVQYAVDLVDPNRQTYTDNATKLEIDSPYNTRKYSGLPYGPISNPGLSALVAAATPDATAAGYLFFLTGDDGAMYYAATDADHQYNISVYCKEMCNVGL